MDESMSGYEEIRLHILKTMWVVAWAEWAGKEYDTRRQQCFEVIAKGEEIKTT